MTVAYDQNRPLFHSIFPKYYSPETGMPVSGIFTQFALFVGIKIGWSFTHLIRRVCSSVKRGDAYLCSKIAVSDRIQTPAKTQSSKTPKSESFYRTHIVQMWIMFMNSICLHHKIVHRVFTWQDSDSPRPRPFCHPINYLLNYCQDQVFMDVVQIPALN